MHGHFDITEVNPLPWISASPQSQTWLYFSMTSLLLFPQSFFSNLWNNVHCSRRQRNCAVKINIITQPPIALTQLQKKRSLSTNLLMYMVQGTRNIVKTEVMSFWWGWYGRVIKRDLYSTYAFKIKKTEEDNLTVLYNTQINVIPLHHKTHTAFDIWSCMA